jgi:hypothetical protein
MLTPLEEWPVTKPESPEPPILQRTMGQNVTLCQLKEALLEPHVTFGARNVQESLPLLGELGEQ